MKRSFTLIELLVVLTIMLLISTMAIPPLVSMWKQRYYAAAVTQMQSMLQLARMRARGEMVPYGILVHIDPLTQKQKAVFIRHEIVAPPISNASYWNRYADRFEVVQEKIYRFGGNVRVGRTDMNMGDLNRFNTFVIIFKPDGTMDSVPRNYHYIVHDPDNFTDLPVNDIVGQWHTYTFINGSYVIAETYSLDSPIKDIISLGINHNYANPPSYTEFDNQWGLIIYDHQGVMELQGYPFDQQKYLQRNATPILLDRQGQIIFGARE